MHISVFAFALILGGLGTPAGNAAPPPQGEVLRRFVGVVPEFPPGGCRSSSLAVRMSVPAGTLEVGDGRVSQPATIALEVQAGPSFRLGETVINWIQAAQGSLTLGTDEQSRRFEVSSYPFGVMAALARYVPAEQRFVLQLPVRLQQGDEEHGHGVLILKGEVSEGSVAWRWAGFLFEELARRHFPAAPPVRQLLGVPVAEVGRTGEAVDKACCFSTACCVCRTTNRCARGDCGILCPECVLNACNECSTAKCHDANCPGCDLG